MERVVRKFASFEEADAAGSDYYRSLTPQERIAIMLDPGARLSHPPPVYTLRPERFHPARRTGRPRGLADLDDLKKS